ncbi:hypothetical protein [Vibrio algivorus]|uniref:Uncharacterized protein n=1 Tax=Vibrio algivorus TaxID=1667024 RepID=A0A557NTY0_9VIBR|nr:hypothetical protein [Vibrio algivorus]TVO31884.1 hypothetical protein FOF44_17630 [Vibrio algivorus]
MNRFNQLKPSAMDWNSTLGQMIANTTTVAGLMTASPIFGPMGRLTGRGVAVSIAVGTALALMGQREPANPYVCYANPQALDEYHDMDE